MEDGVVFLSPKWLLDLVATIFVIPHWLYHATITGDTRIVDAASFIGSTVTATMKNELKAGKISLKTFKVFIVLSFLKLQSQLTACLPYRYCSKRRLTRLKIKHLELTFVFVC